MNLKNKTVYFSAHQTDQKFCKGFAYLKIICQNAKLI